MDWVNKRFGISPEAECRNEMVVGLVGMTLCGLIPRIVVYFVEYDKFTLTCIMLAPLLAIHIFYSIFLYSTRRTLELPYSKYPNLCYVLIAIHVILLITTMKIATGYKTEKEITSKILTQVGSSLIIGPSTIDLILVVLGGVKLKKYQTEEQKRAQIRPKIPNVEVLRHYVHGYTCLELTLAAYCLLAWAAIVFGLVYIISHPSISNFSCLAAIFISFVIVLGLISMTWDATWKCETKLVAGLGGIVIFGLLPRILVFLVGFGVDFPLVFVFLVTPLLCFALFSYYFIFPHRQAYFLHYKLHEKHVIMAGCANLLALLVGIKLGLLYESNLQKEIIISFQVFFSLISTISLIDLVVIWKGGLRYYSTPMEVVQEYNDRTRGLSAVRVEQKPDVPEAEGPVVEDLPRLTCKTCLLPFSDTVIPRILKECGHTICEGCAENLLKKTNNQHLICPSCKMITVVKGPASTLCKNYMIMEFVKD